MGIIKSALVGLAAALLSSVLLVVVTLAIARRMVPRGSGVMISGPFALLVALVAFVAGYLWESRRLHR